MNEATIEDPPNLTRPSRDALRGKPTESGGAHWFERIEFRIR